MCNQKKKCYYHYKVNKPRFFKNFIKQVEIEDSQGANSKYNKTWMDNN